MRLIAELFRFVAQLRRFREGGRKRLDLLIAISFCRAKMWGGPGKLRAACRTKAATTKKRAAGKKIRHPFALVLQDETLNSESELLIFH